MGKGHIEVVQGQEFGKHLPNKCIPEAPIILLKCRSDLKPTVYKLSFLRKNKFVLSADMRTSAVDPWCPRVCGSRMTPLRENRMFGTPRVQVLDSVFHSTAQLPVNTSCCLPTNLKFSPYYFN
jgi:hypothetical protein